MSFKPWLLPFLTGTMACKLILLLSESITRQVSEKTSTMRGLHSIYLENLAIPETASLKDGGIGNTSEEEIPFEYSLAGSFFAVNELKSKKAYDFLKLCVAFKKLLAEKFLAEDALRSRTFHF